MIHKIETAQTASSYHDKVEQLQKDGWLIAMVQYVDNEWVLTCQKQVNPTPPREMPQ